MLHLPAFGRRIECPPIAPADVEHTVAPVKVGPNLMLLIVIAGKATVLPHARELLELVRRHLMIRRVTRLLLLRQHWRTEHWAAPRAKDALRSRLTAPPQHLVQPVHTPVAERPVGKIQRVA